jgi:hypothetical protein
MTPEELGRRSAEHDRELLRWIDAVKKLPETRAGTQLAAPR